MRPTTRDRAIRRFVSSLLESDFSMAEITDLGKAFLQDRRFSEQIGELLVLVADRMRHQDRPRSPGKDDVASDWLRKARVLIKRRRVSKGEIVSALRVLLPNDRDFSGAEDLSVTEILKMVEVIAPEHVRGEFLNWLDVYPGQGDAYLEGIMKGK